MRYRVKCHITRRVIRAGPRGKHAAKTHICIHINTHSISMTYAYPNSNNLLLLILGYILPGRFVAYWDFFYVPVQTSFVCPIDPPDVLSRNATEAHVNPPDTHTNFFYFLDL